MKKYVDNMKKYVGDNEEIFEKYEEMTCLMSFLWVVGQVVSQKCNVCRYLLSSWSVWYFLAHDYFQS